ncbi:MAG: hypothetical protein R8L07_13355 [Alphaproteobacteria bacterium]|nr:hypothetical protein [Alphaproteobacteria bacterium]
MDMHPIEGPTMAEAGEFDFVAQRLLQECGPGAIAYAHARSAECLFYQDQAGHDHWDRIERRIRALRVAD